MIRKKCFYCNNVNKFQEAGIDCLLDTEKDDIVWEKGHFHAFQSGKFELLGRCQCGALYGYGWDNLPGTNARTANPIWIRK